MKKNISGQYEISRALSQSLDGAEFFSNRHKRDREWIVLGAAQKALCELNVDFPYYAEESERPDFLTYKSDGTSWSPVEIAEAMRAGKKRHERHLNAKFADPKLYLLPDPMEDPYKPLQDIISKKAQKGYPNNTSLIVYFDIWIFDFPDWSNPVTNNILLRHHQSPFQDINFFKHVFVLSSDLKTLIELEKANQM